MKSSIIIVYVCDENYLRYVNVSAKSALKLHPKAKIIVVSPEKLDTEFENVVIPLDREYRHNVNDRITSATYLKLFLPELPYDKIIYLDGDTIIQKPLDELWNMDCKFINLCETYSKKHALDLGVKKYGLSGMMVMNLDALRKANFTDKCLNATPNVKHWQHEETLINAVFNKKLKFIDKKWNYCHKRLYDEPISENDVCILHICGKDKSLMNYQLYSEISDVKRYIKGKTVAIVGNAASIFDKQNGKDIDNHDIIIRFNRGFVIRPEAQGTRTDIIILACELNIDEKSSYKAYFSVNRSKNTMCGNLTISNEPRRRLRCLLGKQPSSGFMAVDLCRESEVKSIDLYGFDFEETPTFYNPDGYITQHDYSAEKEILKNLDLIIH